MRTFARDRRGIVMMEFLIALLPVMLAFLGFMQFAFMAVAKLAVRHSAALATRAAIVVIEESESLPGIDDGIYGGLLSGAIEIAGNDKKRDAAKDGGVAQAHKLKGVQGGGSMLSQLQSFGSVLNRDDSRIAQIRTAAYIPLLTVSPNIASDGLADLQRAVQNATIDPQSDLGSAIGSSGIARMLGAFLYNLGAVAVTFPQGPGASELNTSGLFGPSDPITVRVTYLFRCQVPIASLLLCDSGWSLLAGSSYADTATYWDLQHFTSTHPRSVLEIQQWRDELDAWKKRVDARQARIDAFDGHKADFEHVESKTVFDLLLLLPGARFRVLQAEATLPMQGARYYPRETEEGLRKNQNNNNGNGKPSGGMPSFPGTI